MSRFDDVVGFVTEHSWAAVLVMVVLTGVVGAGAPMVDQSSSLDQFQTESETAETLDYVQANFGNDTGNTTTAQVIVRDDNVLEKDSLVAMLEYQQTIRSNGTVAPTLTGDRPVISIANVLATAAIRGEQAAELRRLGERLRALNETVQSERAAVEAERAAVEERRAVLNATADALRASLTDLRQDPNASVRDAFERADAQTAVALNETDFGIFRQAARQLRSAETQSEVEAAYRTGTQGVLADDFAALQERAAALQDRAAELQDTVDELQSVAEQLEAERTALEDGPAPTLEEELAQLRSMNESAIDETIGLVLSGGSGSGGAAGAFAFMPTSYTPGATEAGATMMVVTQRSETGGVNNAASDALVDAQLAMRHVGEARSDGMEYLVFGSGVINHEINASMTDSLLIVGPLAFVFVLLALAFGYRDVLDIVLGLFGIAAVLLWTFGFMGWADIAFNQLFVAVPVLLIGLSIDYAIHIFMRHREERQAADGLGPRGSMRVALGGVGIALVLVTATTVIGFLSNLTSPVPPIREFGVVSSVGIAAALLVFGVLVPALKVELDEFLEARGIDRQKRAIGTGGGRFSSALSVGATAARRAPSVVIVLVLLVSAAGAYGATQVDTSFDQQDFLADDPPAWMEDLPEPFRPGDYAAKANLQYVNENFLRQDSQAQLLVRGDVTRADALERVAEAEASAADKPVTQILSNGEPAVESPLDTMREVAAANATFAAEFEAADADGDGVPDRDVAALYDALFAAAPDAAASTVYRTDAGDYRALRLVVSVKGGASGDAVTEQMRAVADSVDGEGLTVAATGQTILFKIVQDQLLETVIESLLVTLVVIFLFLMAVYRLTDGSATLGVVTLLPVVLSVSWILGTMYLLEIPFNVLTGMITSLTVGLGVAYSIHLSERYNQELDRSDTVSEALYRSVTGTGGALLGSAATTVGGFGVLAFALLPPLRQFGVITGLTIVYAFLASVLVLPSLLVVWTKYAGPTWAAESLRESGASAPSAVGDRPEATLSGTRGAERDYVLPGEAVSVSLSVTGADGRIVLHERFEGDFESMGTIDPSPVEAVVRGGDLYVAWDDLRQEATVEYTVSAPADAADGAVFAFDGLLMTGGGDVAVTGAESVQAVGDLFERILAAGRVTDADLAAASERYAAGDLTEQQFVRVYRGWLRDGADRAPALDGVATSASADGDAAPGTETAADSADATDGATPDAGDTQDDG